MPRTRNALIAVGLLVCVAPARSSRGIAAQAAPAPDGYVEAGAGVRLFFRLLGRGPDTLVALHGGPGFSMDYLATDLAPLAPRHAVLFYDQRGTGRSTLVGDSTALDAQRFAEDLEAVRRHFGFERMALLGHSWGAGLAALYAIRYPDRVARLIIVDAMPLRRAGLTQAFQEIAAGRDSATLRQMEHWRTARQANPEDRAACRAYYRLWFAPFFVDRSAAARREEFCAGPLEALGNKVRSVDRFTFASLGEYDWHAALRGVAAPALVIHGAADPIAARFGREWAEALPNGRLLLLEGAGHFPWAERPEAVFAAISEFVAGRWPAAAARP